MPEECLKQENDLLLYKDDNIIKENNLSGDLSSPGPSVSQVNIMDKSILFDF